MDDLQLHGLHIIQNPKYFCFGMDAVLLSGFARIRPGDRVLDMGSGNGILPLLLSAKSRASSIVGLEIQPACADMARRSIAYNGLEGRISMVEGDIREAAGIFGAASFDCITCNPPYMKESHGLANPRAPKAIARHELLCDFSDVAGQSAKLLKPGGLFFLVHRPRRLAELITVLCRVGLEPKRMRFVHPYMDKEPKMVLLEARKGGGGELRIEPPLALFSEPGVYSREVREHYGF